MGIALKDSYGRVLDYVRISVTDRCNYRCLYCMPEEGIEWIPHEEIMTYEEIRFLVSVLADLGVKRIRSTGGEPFVRKGFVPFLREIRSSFPSMALAVTTNGAFLERDARMLGSIGLESLSISLDTLNDDKFREMTRTGCLQKVLRGIDSAAALIKDASVKLNTVVMRDFNIDEVPDLVLFAKSKGIILRFIEFMPLDRDVWMRKQYVPASEIKSRLPDSSLWSPAAEIEEGKESSSKAPGGPSRYLVNRDSGQRVGFITAVSDHFCRTCNRLRVTSTGEIRPCLFSNEGVRLIEVLRSRDAEGVRSGIISAAMSKPCEGGTGIPRGEDVTPAGEFLDREGLPRREAVCTAKERHMSRIGG